MCQYYSAMAVVDFVVFLFTDYDLNFIKFKLLVNQDQWSNCVVRVILILFFVQSLCQTPDITVMVDHSVLHLYLTRHRENWNENVVDLFWYSLHSVFIKFK